MTQDITPSDVIAFWKEAGPGKWFAKDEAFDAVDEINEAENLRVSGDLQGAVAYIQRVFTDAENSQLYRSYGLRMGTIQLSAQLLGKSLTEVTGETTAIVDLFHPSKTAALNVPDRFATRFRRLKEKGLDGPVKKWFLAVGKTDFAHDKKNNEERCRQSGTGKAFAGRAENDGKRAHKNS